MTARNCWGRCWGLISLLLIGPLLVSGCRLKPRSEGDVRVRLINAVPDAGGLNVSVDRQLVWKRSLFRSNTGYQGLAAGTYPIRIDSAAIGATLITRTLSLEKGHDYTVLALGQMRNGGMPAQVQVWEDSAGEGREPGKAGVRLVNAAPDLSSVDLVINNIVGLKSVPYGKRSVLLTLDGGEYDLKIAAAETPDALVDPIHLRLEPGHAYTLVALGRSSDQTLSLEAYPDTP